MIPTPNIEQIFEIVNEHNRNVSQLLGTGVKFGSAAWRREMESIQQTTRSRFEEIGLAAHIDWSEPEE